MQKDLEKNVEKNVLEDCFPKLSLDDKTTQDNFNETKDQLTTLRLRERHQSGKPFTDDDLKDLRNLYVQLKPQSEDYKYFKTVIAEVHEKRQFRIFSAISRDLLTDFAKKFLTQAELNSLLTASSKLLASLEFCLILPPLPYPITDFSCFPKGQNFHTNFIQSESQSESRFLTNISNAIEEKNVPLVKRLLMIECEPSQRSTRDLILHYMFLLAAKKGQVRSVEVFLNYYGDKININFRSEGRGEYGLQIYQNKFKRDYAVDGCTALGLATFNGCEKIVKILLSRNANPNIQDGFKLGPIGLAVLRGFSSLVTIFLEHKLIILSPKEIEKIFYTALQTNSLRNKENVSAALKILLNDHRITRRHCREVFGSLSSLPKISETKVGKILGEHKFAALEPVFFQELIKKNPEQIRKKQLITEKNINNEDKDGHTILIFAVRVRQQAWINLALSFRFN